jgi:hypothetical protein
MVGLAHKACPTFYQNHIRSHRCPMGCLIIKDQIIEAATVEDTTENSTR